MPYNDGVLQLAMGWPMDRTCRWRDYDADERVSHSINRYELVKDGRLLETEFEHGGLRCYDPDECVAILEEAGFTSIKLYGDYARGPLGDAGDNIIVECTRP